MAEGRHEVAQAGRASAEDARRRRGLLHGVGDGVGRAAQLQPAVWGRPEALEGRAHPEDRILQPVVPQGHCKRSFLGYYIMVMVFGKFDRSQKDDHGHDR